MRFKSPRVQSILGDDQRGVTASQLRGLPSELWVNLIREDQTERWRRGDQLLVESYLETMPELNQRQEDVLVMICGEMQLRDSHLRSSSSDQSALPGHGVHRRTDAGKKNRGRETIGAAVGTDAYQAVRGDRFCPFGGSDPS